MKRAKPEGIRRNVEIALDNSRRGPRRDANSTKEASS